MERIQIEQHSAGGLMWAFGWLFTVGYLQLSFWKGAAAIVVWPYHVGVAVATLLQ